LAKAPAVAAGNVLIGGESRLTAAVTPGTGSQKGTTRSDGDCPSGSIQSARGWKGGGRADWT